MAIDPSGWQVFLVSVTPTHLAVRRCSIIYHTIFPVWLRTWITTLRIQGFLRRRITKIIMSGCVSIIFLLLAICQFPFVSSQWLLWRKVTNGKCGSSFVYNYWSQFNFKRASVFYGSATLRIIFFSHAGNPDISLADTYCFCIPWMFFFSRPASEEIASTLLLDN